MVDNCIYCKIVKGDLPSTKVFESENFITIKDIHPKVDGHSLVISKKHYGNFMEMPSELYNELLECVKHSVEKLGAKDFNLAVNTGDVAGQIIKHFHLHILPRKPDDKFVFGV